jgi:hypothetical protein
MLVRFLFKLGIVAGYGNKLHEKLRCHLKNRFLTRLWPEAPGIRQTDLAFPQ